MEGGQQQPQPAIQDGGLPAPQPEPEVDNQPPPPALEDGVQPLQPVLEEVVNIPQPVLEEGGQLPQPMVPDGNGVVPGGPQVQQALLNAAQVPPVAPGPPGSIAMHNGGDVIQGSVYSGESNAGKFFLFFKLFSRKREVFCMYRCASTYKRADIPVSRARV